MSRVSEAIKYMRATGNLEETVAIALGRREITEFNQVQTQVWHCPNENAVNQLVLFVKNKLDIKPSSIKDYTNGSQGGYAVTFTGDMAVADIASLASRLGCFPLEGVHQPGGLS